MSKFKVIWNSLTPERVKNIRVISLCILAAGTFWFLNALNDNYSTTFKYPVTFIYDEEKYMPIEELPDEIQINVNGLGWTLFRNSFGIRTSPIEIALESPLETKKIAGANLVGLISEQLTELDINFVLTDTLYINFDEHAERKYMLRVDSAAISLEKNYLIVSKVKSDPDSVTLSGPKSILERFSSPILLTINDKNIDDSYNEDVALNLPSGNLITRAPPTFNVNFAVAEFTQRQLLVEITPVNFPEDSSAYLANNTALVYFNMPVSKAESVLPEDFGISANYQLREFDSTLRLNLIKYPKFVRGARIDTSAVKINYNE